ncbi:MAG: hypothetical protein M3Z24_12830 [Chloroflexota bacterium]|nr:hypothetical protein [Chloroflexota bacterium]
MLVSKVSPTQNQWDYLEVLFAALLTARAPKAIMSDGGGIFTATMRWMSMPRSESKRNASTSGKRGKLH